MSSSPMLAVAAPAELPATWRERADLLEAHGAGEAARTCRVLADELEAALRATAEARLTLAEATRESGYSERRLRELLSDGAIPNAGRKHAPRIRRSDLPRKPRTEVGNGFDPASEARRIIAGGG